MSEIKIGYFQVQTPQGIGYVCTALKRPPKDSEDKTHVASFSFCSPKDEFNKRVGRNMAAGRLVKSRFDVQFESVASNTQDALIGALGVAIEKGIAPGWVRKAALRVDEKRIIFGLTQWTPELVAERKRGPVTITYGPIAKDAEETTEATEATA